MAWCSKGGGTPKPQIELSFTENRKRVQCSKGGGTFSPKLLDRLCILKLCENNHTAWCSKGGGTFQQETLDHLEWGLYIGV